MKFSFHLVRGLVLLTVTAWFSPAASTAELRFQHHYVTRDLPVNSHGYGDYGLAALVDIDRDGDLDFVFGGRANTPSELYWFEGAISPAGVADIDGDEDLDVVRAETWFENADGKGLRWAAHANIPMDRAGPFGVCVRTVVTDVDGDGKQELVMCDASTAGQVVGRRASRRPSESVCASEA